MSGGSDYPGPPDTGQASETERQSARPSVTRAVIRGVRRRFAAHGAATVCEMPLANGRRADIVAIDGAALLTIVEVKSGPEDWRSDYKWRDYRAYCDQFFLAVSPDFPIDLIPDDVGLMVADAFDAEVIRPAARTTLAGARRKAMLIRFAQLAGTRLLRLEDPQAFTQT